MDAHTGTSPDASESMENKIDNFASVIIDALLIEGIRYFFIFDSVGKISPGNKGVFSNELSRSAALCFPRSISHLPLKRVVRMT